MVRMLLGLSSSSVIMLIARLKKRSPLALRSLGSMPTMNRIPVMYMATSRKGEKYGPPMAMSPAVSPDRSRPTYKPRSVDDIVARARPGKVCCQVCLPFISWQVLVPHLGRLGDPFGGPRFFHYPPRRSGGCEVWVIMHGCFPMIDGLRGRAQRISGLVQIRGCRSGW